MNQLADDTIQRWISNGDVNTLLDISMLSLYELPSLPANVRRLDISSNNISIIRASELPDSLTELTCKYNGLETIEKLPPNLASLDCSWNRMKTLPNIPASLVMLLCSHNQLRTLPEPPPLSNLRTLLCGNNRRMYLPALESIQCLGAEFNNICVFPKCGPNTYFIGLGYNCIELIPDTLPPRMTEIVLTKNNVKTIDNVRFPEGLITLTISENPITELPANLPNSIKILRCDQMRLSSLPDTLPTALTILHFAHNPITEIPDTLDERCPKLEAMWCKGARLMRDNPTTGSPRKFIIELIRLQRLQAKHRNVTRTKIYKEELIQLVWHPHRLVRMWFSNGLDFEDFVFCYD